MMIITLFVDIATGISGRELPIHEFIFDGFMVITLGAFGIASFDKFINRKRKADNSDDEIG
jgi:hypothetical protein